MKSIAELPIALQELFAELKAAKEAEELVDGTQLAATEDDVVEEVGLLNTDEEVDEDDEEQIDMEAISPAMRAVFN